MYARDVQRALREMRRVLKPRKTTVLNVLMKSSKSSTLDPSIALGSSFSAPGKLSKALSQAGFKQVYEETRNIAFPFPGSPEQAWELVQVGAILFQNMIKGLTPEDRKSAGVEIAEALEEILRRPAHNIHFTSSIGIRNAVEARKS